MRDVLGEINSMAALNHPCLVEFVGACLDPQQFAIVTELAERGSLYAQLHQSQGQVASRTFSEMLLLAEQVNIRNYY